MLSEESDSSSCSDTEAKSYFQFKVEKNNNNFATSDVGYAKLD
jgi:hypothetical protein